VYQEYRQDILLESVLHGGTLGPHESWAALNGSQGDDGSPGSFTQEPDPLAASQYARIPVQWAVVGSDPLQISNTKDLMWVAQNTNDAEDTWRLANRAFMLVNDSTPNSSGDGAPGTRGWYKINGPTYTDTSPGETLKIAAGSLVLTF